MPIAQLTQVRRPYGGTVAVDGVTLALEPGRTCGLLGPNGASKTSVLRMRPGLLRPDEGSVERKRHPGHSVGSRGAFGAIRTGMPQEPSMSVFPTHWPVEHPDRIQLYALGTPNGVKASIALEELELPYAFHKVDFGKREQHDPGYLKINPNNKIPSIIDPDGPGGKPLAIMESGAILHYLATKAGRLFPSDPANANRVLQWMFFQAGSIGPMFGQYGHFVSYAPKDQDHSYAVERYTDEAKRLLGVLDEQLVGRDWIAGDYSIADIMIAPWVGAFEFYGGPVKDALPDFPNVVAYLARFNERPAVKRGVAAVS